MTHTALFPDFFHSQIPLFTLPRTFLFASAQYTFLQPLHTQHHGFLPATGRLAFLARKSSSHRSLLRSSFFSCLHGTWYSSRLPALTRYLSSSLSTLFCSSQTQYRTARSLTFIHLRTHVDPVLPLTSNLAKLFFSKQLILGAYKHFLNPQMQTHSTRTIHFLQFLLFYSATECIVFILPISSLTGRPSHLRTLIWIRASFATTTTFSFCRTRQRTLARVELPHSSRDSQNRYHSRLQLFLSFFQPLFLVGQLISLPLLLYPQLVYLPI